MAMGELLATSLGATFLSAQGIAAAWVDARQYLRAERRHGTNEKAGLLSATCDFAPDARLQSDWRALDRVVITQGFIAANDEGDTVLLGRGGSDTSGSYFAAKLAAARLEIWTDVPGLFGWFRPGDLLATVRVVLPERVDDEFKELMKKWRETKPYDPREGLE